MEEHREQDCMKLQTVFVKRAFHPVLQSLINRAETQWDWSNSA